MIASGFFPRSFFRRAILNGMVLHGRDSHRPYRWLAEYYDQIFTAHGVWFEAARRRILDPLLPQLASACDLGCGTGATALQLAAAGLRMFAVDRSRVMCRITRAKAKQAGVPLRVLQGDMRDFRLPEPVDLVLSEGDAVNHVPEKPDLRRVIAAVFTALKPGGYFYFDVNNRLAFEKIFPETWWLEARGLAVALHGGCNSSGDRAYTDCEWFIREGNCWRRRHERIEEVCWTGTEIRAALREGGFERIRAWDATPFYGNNPVMRPGYRTFYLARKPPGIA